MQEVAIDTSEVRFEFKFEVEIRDEEHEILNAARPVDFYDLFTKDVDDLINQALALFPVLSWAEPGQFVGHDAQFHP